MKLDTFAVYNLWGCAWSELMSVQKYQGRLENGDNYVCRIRSYHLWFDSQLQVILWHKHSFKLPKRPWKWIHNCCISVRRMAMYWCWMVWYNVQREMNSPTKKCWLTYLYMPIQNLRRWGQNSYFNHHNHHVISGLHFRL